MTNSARESRPKPMQLSFSGKRMVQHLKAKLYHLLTSNDWELRNRQKKGDYFIGFNSFLKKYVDLTSDENAGYLAQEENQERAINRPWKQSDFPYIAAWLKANEKPLALTIEACKRPNYYSPLISNNVNNKPGNSIEFGWPAHLQQCREIADGLLARAMLSTVDGKIDEAWRDLLACRRLGRLIARGGTLIEMVVGIAIELRASDATLAYLECSGLTSKLILDRLKELQSLPPMPPIADRIDLAERICHFQLLQSIKRDAGQLLISLRLALGFFGPLTRDGDKRLDHLGDLPEKLTAEEQNALEMMDWRPAVKSANQWIDRIVAAMRIENRFNREKELDKIYSELEKTTKDSHRSATVAKLLHSKNESAGEVVVGIGNILNNFFFPAFRVPMKYQDRSLQIERNLHVAFALAAYKRDQSRYPVRLADLSPKYLATVPDDLYSGKPLIYKTTEKGYLLYSVGPNGKDDGGNGRWTDEPPGDDISVRIPLPQLKSSIPLKTPGGPLGPMPGGPP
jgi:hypothetical protein